MALKKKQIEKRARLALIVALGLLFVASLGLLYYVYSLPLTIKKQVPTYSYRQKGQITYQVHIKPNSVFPEKIMGPERTYFSKLVQSIDTYYSYEFSADQPGKLSGTYSITATVEAPELWSKEFVLVPNTGFSGEGKTLSFNSEYPLKLDGYQEFLKKVGEETGVSAREPKLVIRTNIILKAVTDEGVINEALTPTMTIPLTTGEFIIEAKPSTKKDALTETVTVPDPTNKTKKNYTPALSAALGLLLILFLSFTRGKAAAELSLEERILKQYGDRLVKVSGAISPDGAVTMISFDSIESLIKMADELGKPVIYQSSGAGAPPAYYVFEGATAYGYVPEMNHEACPASAVTLS
ncbi:MAG: DUF5305 family protein [Bacillota bacterium]